LEITLTAGPQLGSHLFLNKKGHFISLILQV